MEKVCKDCKTELIIGDNWTESRKKIQVYVCKSCVRARGKKHYSENKQAYHSYNKVFSQSKKDGNYHVYLLPDDNYVGSTTNIWRRMVDHKSIGRNTESVRILLSTPSRTKAWELEKLLHDIGYEGRHARSLV